MAQTWSKLRMGQRRRNNSKRDNYGAKLFFEVKRYDGDGNLIETVSPDDLITRPIGHTIKRNSMWKRRQYAGRTAKNNGEGSHEAWSKVAAQVKKGAKVSYKKEIV